jgi:hypothetical protein
LWFQIFDSMDMNVIFAKGYLFWEVWPGKEDGRKNLQGNFEGEYPWSCLQIIGIITMIQVKFFHLAAENICSLFTYPWMKTRHTHFWQLLVNSFHRFSFGLFQILLKCWLNSIFIVLAGGLYCCPQLSYKFLVFIYPAI